ncbi:MAG TPA: hypothetical protein VJU82_16945, partial [Acidobacteriaceae bacterium]|nr:hypothetical protein [Acidobacteriaceae bacterium]
MKQWLVLAGLLIGQAAGQNPEQPPVAQPEHMRYMRVVQVPAASGQACAILDAQIFPHAAPSLVDLRLFPTAAGAHEVPYAITMSEPITEETQSARVLNLGKEGGRIAFDLEMPARAYTSVTLQLDPAVHDFIATATVTGSDTPGGRNGRALGAFTLFDLASQRLSRDTTLPLAESTFRYLHVTLNVAPAPGSGNASAKFGPSLVQGAQVPPSREAQILYTPVAETKSITTVGRETRASFDIPERVPAESVSFVLAPGFNGNFSRDVRITATTNPPPKGEPADDNRTSYPEQLTGNILRVHANEAGREIRTEQLSVPAVLGANLQRGAKVEVAIENGDDQPLPIAAVRLEMRRRDLCFDASAAAAGPLNLYYGDDR